MLGRKKKAPAQPVEKPSRQVLRQLARRRRKQPVDVSQTVWHGINDMPKIVRHAAEGERSYRA